MLINAINKHVIAPAGGLLVKVVLTSWVAHLYDNDFNMIEPIIKKYKREHDLNSDKNML